MSKPKDSIIEKPMSELINWSALNEEQKIGDKIKDKTDDPILSRVSKFQSFMNKQIKETMDSEEQEIKELMDKLFGESLSTKEKEELEKIKKKYAEIREEISKAKSRDEVKKQWLKVEEIRKDLKNKLEELNKFIEIGPYKLSKENFKIDSTGWKEETDKDGVRYKVNETGDVWELVFGPNITPEMVGEQMFTWEAAMREMGMVDEEGNPRERKPGETGIPTDKEWSEMFEIITGKKQEDYDGEEYEIIKNKICPVFPGCRTTDGEFSNQGGHANFWSSSSEGDRNAWFRTFSEDHHGVYHGHNDREYGFFFRALQD